MAIKALGYRSWSGRRRSPRLRFWPIARGGVVLVLRRKIFWVFLIFSLMDFLYHSAMIYMVAQVEGQLGQQFPRGRRGPSVIFTGTGDAYWNFIKVQSGVVMMMLALAGGLLVGADFRAGALSFYLSKPIDKIDYFLGKFGAAFALTALITLLPASILFIEYGAFSESFAYYADNLRLLAAIVAYGALVSGFSAILLLGVSALLKRTIAILIAWGGVFVLLPGIVQVLRNAYQARGLPLPGGFVLLNLWEAMGRVSKAFFGMPAEAEDGSAVWSSLTLAAVALAALATFWRRASAVEVVR